MLAGVVDDDVEPAEQFGGLVDRAFDRSRVGDIRGDRHRPAADFARGGLPAFAARENADLLAGRHDA